MESQNNDQPQNYGIDALIEAVVKKANISEEAATQAVDTVLTAVKAKLPEPMAAKLVRVMAGEDSYDTSVGRVTKKITQVTDGARSSSVRMYKETGEKVKDLFGSVKGLFKGKE
jgi:hypothetical protein